MVDFVEYVVSELKSKRLAKANALELIQQFFGRPAGSARLHPLVHSNVSTLTQQRYRSHLSGDEFFLRDHKVRLIDGKATSVLPGVAYIEMARAAIADAVPDLVASSLIAFENVLWLTPFAVNGARDIYIDIDADDDFLAFRVFSEDASGYCTDHASGRARFYDTVEAAPLDIASIRARMQRKHWDAHSVYQMYSQVGIEYGPAHRGIVRMDSTDAQVLAEILLPDTLAGEDNAAYGLHPSLIDSALQAAIGLGERDVLPTDAMLPFALESLCIVDACPSHVYAFVRKVESAQGDNNQLTLDIDLCDSNGSICVQLRGFCARRFETTGAATNGAGGDAVETLIAVPEWSESRDSDIGESVQSDAHSRVLLCDLPAIDVSSLALILPSSHLEAITSADSENLAQGYESVALQVFAHLQAVSKHHAGAPVFIQCVIADSAEGLLLSGLAAMLKTATLENSGISAQIVVTESGATIQEIADQLRSASLRPQSSPIQYRGNLWRTLSWKTVPTRIDGQSGQPYKEDGVYLITGGLGGLGHLVAHDILRKVQHAQVVLTGRSLFDTAIKQRIDISEFAARLHYRSLDLEDLAKCSATIADIQTSIGGITGIFHCAGAHSDNVIAKKTELDMSRVLAPKVRGTWHLDAASRHLDLDFFALFSSGVSVFGNVGQADYAAANGFMDAFSHYRQQLVAQQSRRGKTIVVNWPLWQDGGMHVDAENLQWLRTHTGMTPMRSDSGLAVLARALSSQYTQILALEGEGRKLRRLFDEVTTLPAPAVSASELIERTPGAPAETPATTAYATDLIGLTREFLRKEFAPVLKITASQIDIHEALENYGINSILAMNLTSQLEKHFGPLPKTLFFEYQNIVALSDHLVQAHPGKLETLLTPSNATAAVATSASPHVSSPPARAAGQPRDTTGADTKIALRGKTSRSSSLVKRVESNHQASLEPIAVIGLSGRYPEAETLNDFWLNLRDGKDCIVEIPSQRWSWQDYYTDDRNQRGHYSKWGGFIAGADEFDPQFFNISPREAPYIDPQERIFLQHAWMAIEDAGYSRKSLRIPRNNGLAGQVGVYAGVMYGEYNRSGSLASIANRVSYVLNVHGPSMTLDTMCSSSLTATHLACQDLRSGRIDMALAGGVNLSIHPDKYSMLSAGQFISSTGHCQSFGEGGDGYIPGEGVGVVVLKRLADAERDGDAIYALIRNSALNHGGKTNGYTVPNPQAQAAAIADALAGARVDPRHVSYIEAHGTGTKLGDPIEIVALSKAFQQYTADTKFCMIGSAKSNIGHCESAAGIAGLTKVILQMRHRQIVPSLHSERLNPNIDFDRTPFVVNQQLRAWDAPIVDGKRVPRIAGLSSFGAGGSNAHFVIEEYDIVDSAAPILALSAVIVPMSARTPEQLTQKARDLIALLDGEAEAGRIIDHVSLAYTLQVGRDPMEERLGFVVDSAAQLQGALRAYLDGDASSAFRGHVKTHKDMLNLFVADPDYEEALDKWIAQRKITKLVELWVKGLDLDWQKFYGKHYPRRMHLPTYPFAKEKYWIDPIEGLFPLDTPGNASQRNAVNPLLHENTSDLEQLRFSSVFRGTEAFADAPSVADGTKATLPLTAMLDMARAALGQARNNRIAADTTLELRELRFAAPFEIDGFRALHIALYPSADDAIDFDIYSGDDEYVHAQGKGVFLPSALASRIDIDALAKRMRETSVPIDLSPIFQRFWLGEKEMLIAADIVGDVVNNGVYAFHPALMRAALDAATAVFDLGNVVAHSVESLIIASSYRPNMRIWVRSHPGETNALDMDWCDELGSVCHSWRGIGFASATDTSESNTNLRPIVAVYSENTAMPLRSVIATIDQSSAASLVKPNAVALADLAAMPEISYSVLSKPTVSRLAALDNAISASVASMPAPLQQTITSVAHTSLLQPSVVTANVSEAPRRREDVRSFLKRSLSESLYLDIANIEDDRSFVDLGLDSIVGVEWIKVINKQLGLAIAATRVYDYANIAALSAYIETQLPPPDHTITAGTSIAHRSAPKPDVIVTAETFSHTAIPSIEELQPELRRSLAQALYLDESAIDNDQSFVDLGLDSIVGVEWVKVINKAYGLEVSATRVYDYSTISSLAAFLHNELAKRPPEHQPSRDADSPLEVAGISPPASITIKSRHQPLPSAAFASLQRRRRTLTAPIEEHKVDESRKFDDKIAIVGMSGRYPDAENLDQFWRNLVEAKNSIKEIPPDRWNVNAYYDPTPGKPGKVYCKWLGLLDGAEHFDPMFFQISPSEAEIMDPQHRLFMQESYRAFEDACYSPSTLSNKKCGVYLGIMSSEYSFLLAKGNPLNVETTGNSFAIGSARIAYHLNLKGPAIPIDTACSSSLVAIHLACQALINREIDMALAGGVSLYLIPESYVGMCRAGMLARDGQCKTFDNSADGFVPGEGVGTVVLKRLSDAERDGDGIYGVIIGSGINQDGKTNGITAPSVNSQIELERGIYSRYGIDAATISYVETHGTGTKLGDPIELEALSTVFKEYSDKKHYCALGAVKTNIGHVSGAAGVAGVHKVLLSMRHKMLVPNVNLREENTLFDFDNSPFYFNKAARDWATPPGEKRRAAVSAFGFSGTNAHIVIEEYVAPIRHETVATRQTIVPLSARTEAQLRTQANELLEFVTRSESSLSLRDLAYSLQIGRDAMRERCAWVVDSIADLRAQLSEFVSGDTNYVTWLRGSVSRGQDSASLTREASVLLQGYTAQQSTALATLWAKGGDIPWQVLYGDDQPQRLHLPNYPFAKERYWPDSSSDSRAPIAEAAAASLVADAALMIETTVAKEQTYFAPIWRASPLSLQRIPFGRDDVLMILDVDDHLFEQIKARLHVATPLKAIVLVSFADGYRQHSKDSFSVDASRQEDFDSLLSELEIQGRRPTHVIHNVNAGCLSSSGLSDEALQNAIEVSIGGLFGLCKSLIGAKASTASCAFVSFFYTQEENNAALCEALAAFYRSFTLENSRYHGRAIALNYDGVDMSASVVDTLTCIIDELQSPAAHETAVRYRAMSALPAQRQVRILERQHPERQLPRRVPPLKHRGVYIVSGGLGGLGYLFARHLAERYAAKLVLSGRSAIDERLQRKIDDLHKLGAEVIYVPGDIADAKQVSDLIACAKTTFGQINGVLHSAGINRDALLIKKDGESMRQVLAPKVQGTIHLDRLTSDESLDFFVMFSSGAGSFGNIGQTDYAYANAFMDAFAAHRESLRARRQRFGKTLSIGWPYWQEGGMHVSATDLQRTEQRTGFSALPTEIGLSYWDTLLASDMSHVLALYGDPAKIASYCAPSAAPVAASSPQAMPHETHADRETLLSLTLGYLCELVHNETKLPIAKIDINERFEAFGFDSIMIGRFNASLERDLGELPKTLMYEYETVAELAGYLCDKEYTAVSRMLITENTTEELAIDSYSAVIPAEAKPLLTHAEPIAIIGFNACLPKSKDQHALWENLKAGKDLIELVPENRWSYQSFYDADPAQAENGKIYCKWGGFLEDFDKFDASFFNITDAEANIIDPQERCFLQSAWAAVEDAGYTRDRLKTMYPKGKSADVGVFVGVTTNSYHLLAPDAWRNGQMVTPSAMPWSIANRVSYYFDFQGPSMPIDTACSSSLVAVHLACESLRRNECRVALAGGVNLYLHPAKYQSFCQRRMLALGDRCRSYGAGDDGFVPGEGVGTLVLKPLRLAEADGDHVVGVIRGSAFDHSGRSNGYAAPNPNAQAQVITQALAQADIPARSISFIEGHGTGTQMGDSLEIAAITQAFGLQTDDKQFCALASVKANIGHAESATSIAGIVKILLQFKHRQIVPSIHADVVNPDIDFTRSPCFLQTQLTHWNESPGFPRRALINAFGAGGVNASAVLEEYVPENAIARHSDASCLFVLSAMNLKRLHEYAGTYVDFFDRSSDCDLAGVCYTAQVGRESMPERLAILVSSTTELRDTLREWLALDLEASLSSTRVWRGSLDARSSAANPSRESREKMQVLCEEHDLSALADIWTQGGKVEWKRLYAERSPSIVSLPSYPFARERHWITESSQCNPGSTPSNALPRLHPLISHNASTLKQIGFEAALADDQYYATDHKIQGRAVFPGAGFIEMACVAATIAGQRRVHLVKDVFWLQPLTLDQPPNIVKLGLQNAIGDSAEFTVTTLDDDQENVLHCEGRIVFRDHSAFKAVGSLSLLKMRERCTHRSTGSVYYQRFKRLGFDYGRAFQVMEEVSLGDGCALAKLRLDPGQTSDFEQYILHPCLIDGALQTVVALLSGEDGGVPHLPFAIDEIEIMGSLTPTCYAFIERSGNDREAHANVLQFNVHIMSESGEPLVMIRNFFVRALVTPETSTSIEARIRTAQLIEVNS